MLQIGYAQTVITPTLDRPVYLAGFGLNRVAASVHDDLYARALALDGPGACVVIVALDLIGLGRQHCQEIEQRVAARAPGWDPRLWVACTHTHHGPDTIGLWGPDRGTSGVDPAYVALLKDTVVDVALEALAGLRPAAIRVAAVEVPGVAKNARDPDIVDDELSCIQFCDPDTSAPLATGLIFPCHPEVLWDDNPHVSSDYFGPLRRVVEVQTEAPCVALVGALGGMMTPDVETHSFEEAKRVGCTLAAAALQALSGRPASSIPSLSHRRAAYDIPLSSPLFQMAMAAGLLPDLLNPDGTLTTEANLLQLGPAWLLGVPGELLPALGLAFKAELGAAGAQFPSVVGLTNDELGYILPEPAYIYPDDPFAPGAHYEETMSVGREAGPRLHAAVRSLLSEG